MWTLTSLFPLVDKELWQSSRWKLRKRDRFRIKQPIRVNEAQSQKFIRQRLTEQMKPRPHKNIVRCEKLEKGRALHQKTRCSGKDGPAELAVCQWRSSRRRRVFPRKFQRATSRTTYERHNYDWHWWSDQSPRDFHTGGGSEEVAASSAPPPKRCERSIARDLPTTVPSNFALWKNCEARALAQHQHCPPLHRRIRCPALWEVFATKDPANTSEVGVFFLYFVQL